jgi:hypothetical protein
MAMKDKDDSKRLAKNNALSRWPARGSSIVTIDPRGTIHAWRHPRIGYTFAGILVEQRVAPRLRYRGTSKEVSACGRPMIC